MQNQDRTILNNSLLFSFNLLVFYQRSASQPFLLVSQHPVTTEYGSNRQQIEETLDALNKLKMPTIMLWPNIDAGSDHISKGIRTFREKIDLIG